ncbi:MAG: DUF1549 domain-containing protein [Planctomycetota bacterium]|nr:DUF1549 domain-containing protein [Planctomycetota bacterium]
MSTDSLQHEELLQLLESLCEDCLDRDGVARLEELVLGDAAARQLYLEYISLHGTLYWEAAGGVAEAETRVAVDEQVVEATRRTTRRRPVTVGIGLAVAAALVLTVGLIWQGSEPGAGPGIADVEPPALPEPVENPAGTTGSVVVADPVRQPATISAEPGTQLANKVSPEKTTQAVINPDAKDPIRSATNVKPGAGSLAEVVGFVDEKLAAGWRENQVSPSPVATDSEWLRRVHLDIVGHIPPANEVVVFLKDRDPRKRAAMIDRLLDDSDYVRHSTTIWSNLLVGRMERREVNRPAFEKFLRESFARNRPWNEMVNELVAARGRNDQNGATNFLLAHLNNDATPATAITARLFLGTQVQCTQCHNHPFNEWRQEQFHGLTAFFKSTRSRSVRDGDAFELISGSFDGAPYYEDRQGVLHVAPAGLGGQRVDLKGSQNPRGELARLMTGDGSTQLALAMVNRTWARLLGHGFTSPVDDMGPHNPPSHSGVIDRLAGEFVASGFDVKQLVRWICNTRIYGLTSRMTAENSVDEPTTGGQPLFSRVYTKPMSVEQLYDSLLVATQVDRVTASDWESVAANRRRWQSQFVYSFQTDENDEAVTFDGSITQAMMMMNGPLIREALSQQPGSYFHQVVHTRGSDIDRIKRLCLSALGRFPSSAEMKAIGAILPLRPSSQARQAPVSGPLAEGLQDVFWAYLNSNEFITVP